MKGKRKKKVYFLIFVIWIFLLVYSVIISKEEKIEEPVPEEPAKEVVVPEIAENIDYRSDLYGKRMYGFFSDEGDYAWAGKSSAVELDNSQIKEKGLELEIQTLLTNLKQVNENVTPKVKVYINGIFMDEIDLYDNGRIYIIPGEKIPKTDMNRYYIAFESNASFKPSEIEESADNRDLAFQVLYIGEKR